MRMKQIIKKLILGEGRHGRRMPFGLYRGLTLAIDPLTDSSFYFGLYERETMKWLQEAGKSARTLIDVGAGCGELSVWGLAHSGMERVIAYDASPERWPIFQENVRINGFASDQRLTTVEGMFTGLEHGQDNKHDVASLPEPILLKIDVDGGEEAILKNMRDVLPRKHFAILVETHSKDLDDACFRILSDAHYRARRIAKAWWRVVVPEYRPIEFNQWIVAEPK